VRIILAERAAAEPAPALVELVERFSLIDALDEGAPAGALTYLEKLAEVLEDGEVTAEEAVDLEDVATVENLGSADITAANQAFVLALAHAALEDGKVSRAERTELLAIAELLGVNAKVVPALLDRAEHARNERLGTDLGELPADWPHGEPVATRSSSPGATTRSAPRWRPAPRNWEFGSSAVSLQRSRCS
jgi:DNA polymerase-3 subunit epsilon